MIRILNIVILLAGVIITSPGRSDSQDADARAAFAKGTEAYRNLSFSQALLYFEEAYRLRPSYKIQYNIAQTYIELSRPHLALAAFERYLSDGRGQLDEARRDEVVIEIRKLRQVVGEIVVTGKTGTECRIDDEHVGFLPLDRAIRLETGLHEISLHLHGEVVCLKKVKIVAGKKRIEQCQLQGESMEGADPESAWDVMSDTTLMEYDLQLSGNGVASKRNPKFIKVAPWLMSGFAVAALATGSVLALKAASLNSELKGACPGGECPMSRTDDIDRLPKLAAGADIMFVVTSLFTAVAVTLFVVKHKKKESLPQTNPIHAPREIEEELSQYNPQGRRKTF
ncbi:MAG: hypothetical protein JXX14_22780 [Deltaproteobacteria bacterium]|nr:hypothetical protein [Deltaproteobacteria bacterium]